MDDSPKVEYFGSDETVEIKGNQKIIEELKNGILGVDYGGSSCCLSQWQGGGHPLDTIKFPKFNNRRFPSAISYLPQYNEWVIGDLAEGCMEKYPKTSFINLKRHIGENITMMTQDEEATSEDILRHFFEILKKLITELPPPRTMQSLVISVPYCFYEYQRASVIKCAREAGLPVLGLINDPEAILLSYCFEDRIEKYEENIMVIDIGEVKLDIAIFEVRQKKNYIVINCINTEGSPELGGEDIDRVILKKILEKNSLEGSEIWQEIIEKKQPLMGNLKTAINDLKQKLSIQKEENLMNFRQIEGLNQFQEITQVEFNQWLGGILSTIKEHLHKTLDGANIKTEKINKVLVNGGTANLPAIKEIIEKLFDNQSHKILYLSNEMAVSQGAAIYGAILKGKTEKFGLNPINPYAIGVEMADGIFDDIIIKGKRLPCSGKKVYQLSPPGSTEFDLNVYQGNKKQVDQNVSIMSIGMPGLNPVKEDDYIIISINLDENCIGELKLEIESSNICWTNKFTN